MSILRTALLENRLIRFKRTLKINKALIDFPRDNFHQYTFQHDPKTDDGDIQCDDSVI